MSMDPARTAVAINALGSTGFHDALIDLLRATAEFDGVVLLAYPERESLRVLYQALHQGDKQFDGPYTQGLFVLSPLYQNAMAGKRGYFHLPEIAPVDFNESEFYALYYGGTGTRDHSAYLLEAGDGTPIVISLERTRDLPPYSEADMTALRELTPVLAALLAKQWPSLSGSAESTAPDLRRQVERVLEQFGCSVLTPREREVVQLVLRGHPSKTVARELGISAHTEQVHRKNIYQKLQLSSHNALFSLFFELLGTPFDGQGDPLDLLERQS